MRQKNSSWEGSQLIKLKGPELLEKYRRAGRAVAGCLSLLENIVKEGTSRTLLEMDKLAEEFIRDNECTPTFLGYKGFPNSVCISLNRELVHTIPNNRTLRDGDIITFDLGATFQEAIGDAALTTIFGEPKSSEHIRLIKATQEALSKAIISIKEGARLGVIGNAISKCAQQYGLSVVTQYGGHGIELNQPHAFPFVSNKDNPNNGVRFAPGMVIAIEPLFVIGQSNKTTTLDDKWTVICDNICSHHESTIYIHDDYHVEILTERK